MAKRPDYYRELKRIAENRRRMILTGGPTHTPQEWLELKAKYDFKCLKCGRKEPEIELTEDHILPLSAGGTDVIDNIQPLCRFCNTSKWTKFVDYRPLTTQAELALSR